MAYDLWTKKQTSRDWSIGDATPLPTYPPQWPGRRRHRHRRLGTPPQQPWVGTPSLPANQAYPYNNPGYAPYNPYASYAPPAPYDQYSNQGPQPTIDVFVGRALAAGVPRHSVQSALVRRGYDPHQIAAIVGWPY